MPKAARNRDLTARSKITKYSVVTYRRPDRKPFMRDCTARAVATGRRKNGSIEIVHLSHGGNEWIPMEDIIRVRPYQEVTE